MDDDTEKGGLASYIPYLTGHAWEVDAAVRWTAGFVTADASLPFIFASKAMDHRRPGPSQLEICAMRGASINNASLLRHRSPSPHLNYESGQ